MKNIIIIGLLVCFPRDQYMDQVIEDHYQVAKARDALVQGGYLDKKSGEPSPEFKEFLQKTNIKW